VLPGCSELGRDLTVAVPIVRSTRLYPSSRLCASLGMAIAYARGDEHGHRYRDLLELCVGHYPITIDTAIAMVRRLFPDVPVSDYNADEMEVDDVVMLARLAVQRDARVLPVLVYDERFQPDGELPRKHALVLNVFHPDDASKRSFFDPEPPQVGDCRIGTRLDQVPSGFQCLVFGWLPPSPAADHAGGRNAK
jgi:hypothetical protein